MKDMALKINPKEVLVRAVVLKNAEEVIEEDKRIIKHEFTIGEEGKAYFDLTKEGDQGWVVTSVQVEREDKEFWMKYNQQAYLHEAFRQIRKSLKEIGESAIIIPHRYSWLGYPSTEFNLKDDVKSELPY